MHRHSATLALGLLVACGSRQRPAPAEQTAPACNAVAEHLFDLANRDNEGEANEGLASGIRSEFVRQCTEERWSAERRACLTKAARQEDTTFRKKDAAEVILEQLRLAWGEWPDDDGKAFAESDAVAALRKMFVDVRADKDAADRAFEELVKEVLNA